MRIPVHKFPWPMLMVTLGLSLGWLLWNAPSRAQAKVRSGQSTLMLTVDNTSDNPVLNACTSAPNDCSLRGALAFANGQSGAAVIGFDTVVFNTPQTITLTNGSLQLNNGGTWTINGRGLVTLLGNPTHSVLTLFSINQVTLQGLTINGGTVTQAGFGYQNGTGIHINPFSGNSPQNVVNIVQCLFVNNEGAFGGALYTTVVTTNVVDSTFRNNYANQGAAISNASSVLNIVNSTFTGNRTAVSGGGALQHSSGYNYPTSTRIINSTISGNQANGAGGGLAISEGSLALVNSTIVNNSALGEFGGGLFVDGSGTVEARNTVIAGNTAPSGPDIAGGISSQGFNFIGNNADSTVFTQQSSDQVGTPGAVLNPLLGPLSDHGGATQTHAPLPGSPLLDKGGPATDPRNQQPLTTDQRGQARPYNLPTADASGGNGSDIGAYEHQCTPITLNSLPNGTVEVTYSTALVATGGTAPHQLQVTGGELPAGLTLNGNGTWSGYPNTSGSFTFTITATDAYGCTGSRLYNVTIQCLPLTLAPASLAAASLGTSYSQNFSATPGGSFNFAVTTGTLPPGLSLTSAGSLNGTPTVAGSFSFTVTASNAGGCAGSQMYTLTVACPTISLTPTSLPTATAGSAYNQSFTASPTASYTFSLASGSLPPGLNLSSTGNLTGTPTTTGSYNFSVKAERAAGCNTTRSYTLSVTCPTISVNPASLPNGTAGTSYSQALSATPSASYSFALSAGSLPSGLSLSTAGVLSGVPTSSGTFNFTVRATAFGNCANTRSFTLTIAAACATITLPSLPNGVTGANYYGDLSATTPSGSYTFSVVAGALPAGLALDNFFGALTGMPTAAGTFNFTLQATSATGCTATRAYTVSISQ